MTDDDPRIHPKVLRTLRLDRIAEYADRIARICRLEARESFASWQAEARAQVFIDAADATADTTGDTSTCIPGAPCGEDVAVTKKVTTVTETGTSCAGPSSDAIPDDIVDHIERCGRRCYDAMDDL